MWFRRKASQEATEDAAAATGDPKTPASRGSGSQLEEDSEMSEMEADSELDGEDGEDDPALEAEPVDVSDGEEDEASWCCSGCCSPRTCIRRCGYFIACLRCLTWGPFLFIYGIACVGMIGYYLYLNYLVIFVMLSAGYIVFMILFVLVAMFFNDMKSFVRRQMHRVLIDLPRNLAIEVHRTGKKHYKRAKKKVKDASKTVEAEMDRTNRKLQRLLADMGDKSDGMSQDIKSQTAKLIALFKQQKMGRSNAMMVGQTEKPEAETV